MLMIATQLYFRLGARPYGRLYLLGQQLKIASSLATLRLTAVTRMSCRFADKVRRQGAGIASGGVLAKEFGYIYLVTRPSMVNWSILLRVTELCLPTAVSSRLII